VVNAILLLLTLSSPLHDRTPGVEETEGDDGKRTVSYQVDSSPSECISIVDFDSPVTCL
jgi:hypothetical protein